MRLNDGGMALWDNVGGARPAAGWCNLKRCVRGCQAMVESKRRGGGKGLDALGVCVVERMAGTKSARLCEKKDGSEICGGLKNEARGETGGTRVGDIPNVGGGGDG